ncbi:MAG: nitroreductase [Clostridiales bacterium]|nr:nitroreductase [Clostridiales bacterium]
MTPEEAIKDRHSVRKYLDRPIPDPIRSELQNEIESVNRESGLNIQVFFDEPKAFASFLAKFGRFSGVSDYFALVGKESTDLDEKIGYYGERIVLKAQMLGLNTCWVAETYGKKKCKAQFGREEKLVAVIALGYGENPGVPHKSKPMEILCNAEPGMPDRFVKGMEAAMLAPTAMNQQKFFFERMDDVVIANATGTRYAKIDLGIVKYHFEIGAGKENFTWG